MAGRGPVPMPVTGPLASHETALRTELAAMGYASKSVADAVLMMARLSRWMESQQVEASELSPDVLEEFLRARRAATRVEGVARRGLGSVLRVLRGRHVVPGAGEGQGSSVETLLAAYRDYLVGERSLAAESVRCYLVQGRKFLDELDEPLEESLGRLDAAMVTAFVMRQARLSTSVWSAKTLVTATRSLLRFLHVQGMIGAPLVGAVPAVAGWRLSGLPRGLDAVQVEGVLAGPDTSTAAGLRDHAVLTVLARLGLRGAEAAALGLADVDWHAGEIIVRGKGSCVERIPLPIEVGQVLAAYLTGGRPVCDCPALFVTARAPYHALSGTSVRAIMGRACRRAGLPRLGAHRLRHTVATDLLRAGAPLTEVGQLLRHRSQLSTTVYAKVDHAALRSLARAWPLAAPSGSAS
ncbi:tyrosine-type recombinase/integrase [Streptosporangium canum]|uniref:tyrosine-type recombinase/integrase n=1 Tax=Streptosporangium canum TaxID=324952 RepID=UPI0034312218